MTANGPLTTCVSGSSDGVGGAPRFFTAIGDVEAVRQVVELSGMRSQLRFCRGSELRRRL